MEHRGNKRFYMGLLLVFVGGFLVLERLGLIPESVTDVFLSWQMLLIGIGIISYLGGNRTGSLILICVGTFFLLPDLFDITDKTRRAFWPLVLVLIGVALLWKHKGKKDEVIVGSKSPSTDYFDDFVIFGGREIFVNSQHMIGGKATAIFGGIEYDLRQSIPSESGSIIDCVAVFGGCGFKIPMDWSVRNEVTTIFGAFTDKRGESYPPTSNIPSKTITIKGISLFGGVEVKHA
jgi:predicted membrane protein